MLERPTFDRYLSKAERHAFFELLSRVALVVEITRPVSACRDPKDDKFLEVAVNGEADALITGDEDLLCLHPYLGIPVLNPNDFLARFGASEP